MNLRPRIDRLEQQAEGASGPRLDFSGLDPQERAELRAILKAVAAEQMTPEEARAQVAQHRIGAR